MAGVGEAPRDAAAHPAEPHDCDLSHGAIIAAGPCRARPGRRYARRVDVLDQVGQGLWNAFQMAWEVWWALVLGFLLSGIVQAWVPRTQMARALGGRGPRSLALATGLGAASSSCSYAAVAIAKSAFQKGASFPAAMAFQFASTNLVSRS